MAAFAGASARRLVLVQLIFAAIAAVAVAYFFHAACAPAIQAAIDSLPANGQIQSGQLNWSGGSQMLADGRFLAFDVDPDHSGQLLSTTADFQIEFGRSSIRVISLLGYADFPYPPGQTIPFNQPQLDPLWKAWRAEILFFIALLTFVILPITWWILAAIYFLPAWLIGFLTNRNLDLRASLKLSCAALLPGSLVMIAAIVLYALGVLNLVSFCFVFAAHFVLQWLYLLFGLLFFPRASAATPKGNPFKTGK